MDWSKIKLEELNKDQLGDLRRELAGRRATIDRILDRQAYGSSIDNEDELNEESDLCEELIKKIDTMLNIKKR